MIYPVHDFVSFVAKEQRGRGQAYTWQVTAGIFARYSRQNLSANVSRGHDKEDVDRLAILAVASSDEHTIKLTSACKREWLRNPDPRLLAAAAKRIRKN